MDAEQWDFRYSGAEPVWSTAPNIFVVQLLSGLTPGAAIDLGAGEGRNAVWLARAGWSVLAVDFSAVGLQRAGALAERAGVALTTVVADAAAFEPDEPVDLVLLSYLQITDERQKALISRIPAWLRPGGTVLIVAHDKSNVRNGQGGPPDERVCYSADATAEWLAPLVILQAGVFEREVSGADRPALDTVVLARREAPPADPTPERGAGRS